MKQLILFAACVILVWLISITSCKKPPDDPAQVPQNRAPVANAGTDQSVKLPVDSVLLSGGGSDPGGEIVSYNWSKVSGPIFFTIVNPDAAVTKVKNLAEGNYLFVLKVTDDGGLIARDSVIISVRANDPPVADAGADHSVTLSSCNDKAGIVKLDGTASSDPDSNIVSYSWAFVSGPEGYALTNSNSAKAQVENMSAGVYVFELTVRDAQGLISADQIMIRVCCPAKQYDFDVTFNSILSSFIENVKSCDYYDPSLCIYHDDTEILGIGNFPPIGSFIIHVSETADTAALSDVHNTQIHIYRGNDKPENVGGSCSVNFKKLIEQGGGMLTGTFDVSYGSPHVCNPEVFTNLPPLEVTGNIDMTTQTITLRIKGKIYF